jgi:hypothetical protein
VLRTQRPVRVGWVGRRYHQVLIPPGQKLLFQVPIACASVRASTPRSPFTLA